MNSTLQGNYAMGEYSTVSNCRLSRSGTGEEVRTNDQLFLHDQVDNEMKNPIKKQDTADQHEEWPPSAIYAQVDKKSKKKEKSPPQTPEH